MITELTPSQEALIPVWREKYFSRLHDSEYIN